MEQELISNMVIVSEYVRRGGHQVCGTHSTQRRVSKKPTTVGKTKIKTNFLKRKNS